MEMLDIVLSFVPHYTRWDVLRYIDFQEEKTMNRTHLSVRMLCEAFAVRWGTAPGLMAGFVFGLLQLIFDGAYAWGWQSMLLDYLAAFTPLGLAGLFKGRTWGIFAGTVVGCAGRFLVHYISGVTIYKILVPTAFMNWTFTSPSFYSIVYNGSYMLPNTVIALAIAALLYKPMKRYILGQDIQ